MSIQIDPTVLSMVVVLVVLGAGLFNKDIEILALGALALLVLFLMAKIIYFEAPVFFAMIALAVMAMYGKEITGIISNGTGPVEIINPEDKDKEKQQFIEEVKKAYAEQYAPQGTVISVDWDYATRLFKTCNVAEDELKGFLIDENSVLIFLGGVETIDKIAIATDRPLPPCKLLDEMIRDRRAWVKVRIGDRDNIWVRVKAYIGIVPWKFDFGFYRKLADGAVWNIPITKLDSYPLYQRFIINHKINWTEVYLEKYNGLFNREKIAKKIDQKSHYWPYDMAEV